MLQGLQITAPMMSLRQRGRFIQGTSLAAVASMPENTRSGNRGLLFDPSKTFPKSQPALFEKRKG